MWCHCKIHLHVHIPPHRLLDRHSYIIAWVTHWSVQFLLRRGLHFDLSVTPVKFHDCVYHGPDATHWLNLSTTLTERKKSVHRAKHCCNRCLQTTFSHDDTDSQGLSTKSIHAINVSLNGLWKQRAASHPIRSVWRWNSKQPGVRLIPGFVMSVHFPFLKKIDIVRPFAGLFTAFYFCHWHFHQYDINTVDLFC